MVYYVYSKGNTKNESEMINMTNTIMNNLPTGVQEQAKGLLKGFSKVHVTYENGEHKVSTGVSILASYSDDYEYIGEINSNEVFTEDERMLNYFTEFTDFPREYKGKRDWNLIQEMKEAPYSQPIKVKLENGNFVKA